MLGSRENANGTLLTEEGIIVASDAENIKDVYILIDAMKKYQSCET